MDSMQNILLDSIEKQIGKPLYEGCRSCEHFGACSITDIQNAAKDKECKAVSKFVIGKWERKHGTGSSYYDWYKCSICGGISDHGGKYCPHCGRRMEY